METTVNHQDTSKIVPVETDIFKELLALAKFKLNVLLIGDHGIGKTEIMKQICVYMGWKYIYFSASTLDPYCDLVGIPSPEFDKELGKKMLKYIRDHRLEDAKIIILDELNRSFPKVRNACFELIQFKALQGVPLPELELVWAGCNNPDTEMNYAVEEMDPALMDRFNCYVKMEANPIAEVYASKGIPLHKAKAAIAWWQVLKTNAKRYVTPRRVEYMLDLHMKGVDLKYSIPPSGFFKNIGEVPLNTLHEALSSELTTEELHVELKDYTVDWVKESYQEAIMASYQLDHSFQLVEAMKGYKVADLNDILHVIKKCAPEFQYALMSAVGPKIEKNVTKTKKNHPALFDWLVETRKKHQATINAINPNVQHNVTKVTATVNNQGQITSVTPDAPESVDDADNEDDEA